MSHHPSLITTAVQAGRLDEPAADRQSTRVIRDIIRNIGAGKDLTKT